MTSDVLGDTDPRLFMQERGLTKIVQYDLPPMFGGSRHRNEPDINDNSGDVSITDDGGELRLHLGADGADRIDLPSSLHSQYRSGTYGDVSIGMRINEPMEGGQKVLWGHFDEKAGAGYGLDKDGLFTFWRQQGDDTIYRADSPTDERDWNRKGEDVSIDISDGHIFHILMRMYGHGPLLWYTEVKDESTHGAPPQVLDKRVYPGSINIADFNKPLRVVANNGGTDQTLNAHVAGRQFTLWGDQGTFEKRSTSNIIKGYTTSTTNWEPMIAVRKKSTFPPGSSRPNSVRAVVAQIAARADADAEIRYTQEADVINSDADFLSQGSMQDPAETAVETIIDNAGTNGNEYTSGTSEITLGSDKGDQLAHGFLTGGKFSAEPVQEDAQVPMGRRTVGVMWVRSASSNTAVDAALRTEQQF